MKLNHVLREHAGRVRDLRTTDPDAARWNIAADAAINDDLLTEGLTLPAGAITPAHFTSRTGNSPKHYHD
jgi:hypothetical protein